MLPGTGTGSLEKQNKFSRTYAYVIWEKSKPTKLLALNKMVFGAAENTCVPITVPIREHRVWYGTERHWGGAV